MLILEFIPFIVFILFAVHRNLNLYRNEQLLAIRGTVHA